MKPHHSISVLAERIRTARDEAGRAAKQEFVDGLNDELSDLQAELEEAEEDEDEVKDVEKINRLDAEIDALTGFIADVEKYEF
jgi:predicted  nucleic acid-binding Zn-ribbon protein